MFIRSPSSLTATTDHAIHSRSESTLLYRLTMNPYAQWFAVVYLIFMVCLTAFVVGYGMYMQFDLQVDPLTYTWFLILEGICDSFVFLEVVVRLVVYKSKYFDSYWAIVDIFIAVACVSTMVLDFVRRSETDFMSVQLVNALRIIRGFIRVLRLIHFIHWLARSYIVLHSSRRSPGGSSGGSSRDDSRRSPKSRHSSGLHSPSLGALLGTRPKPNYFATNSVESGDLVPPRQPPQQPLPPQHSPGVSPITNIPDDNTLVSSVHTGSYIH
eukprot:PhF_6_TR40622/c0_g1_i1/m.60946